MRGRIVAGRYRLHLPLGSGGMAEVWSATNTFTERQVAIKFMSAELTTTPEAAARFLKEAKVSARIGHPNIIDVLDVGQTEEGQLFLVMELLSGESLEDALRRRSPPLAARDLVLVMTEVAGALAAAHRAGVVHRDLKPSNVFLHRAPAGVTVPKILDFGVSKSLDPDDDDPGITLAGAVLGSPLYMSPEQARGDALIDGRTDIFAFGAILFEALTGFRAYDAKNGHALIVKIATSRPKDIDACAPRMPESLRRIVRGCLEPRLAVRFSSFDEVLRLLALAAEDLARAPVSLPPANAEGRQESAAPEVFGGGGVSTPPAEPRPAQSLGAVASVDVPPPSPRGAWLVAIAAGLVAIAFGGGALMLSARAASPAPPAISITDTRSTNRPSAAPSATASVPTTDGNTPGPPVLSVDALPNESRVEGPPLRVRSSDHAGPTPGGR